MMMDSLYLASNIPLQSTMWLWLEIWPVNRHKIIPSTIGGIHGFTHRSNDGKEQFIKQSVSISSSTINQIGILYMDIWSLHGFH